MLPAGEELSVSEARGYVALLELLASMHGYLEIERLRDELEKLKVSRDRPALEVPAVSELLWGKGAVEQEAG